jgi:ABC-type uncharacterized transport system substrate-binding protein
MRTFCSRWPRTLLVMVLALAPAWSHAARVTVLLSDESAPYREVAKAMAAALAEETRAGLDIRVVSLAELPNLDAGQKNMLIVTVGSAATQRASELSSQTPILATLIPKRSFEIIAAGSNGKLEQGRLAALYLDQPVDRQVALVKAALPRGRSFGVLMGLHSYSLSGLLLDAAEKLKLKPVLSPIASEDELFRGLQQMVTEVDAILAVPDSTIINRQTIRNFLLTTYRARIPVFGYAQSHVGAGVLAAVFSTPSQIGQQTGELVRKIIKSHLISLPPSEYPHYYTVKANYNVARSLNIPLPDEESLRRELQKSGEGE